MMFVSRWSDALWNPWLLCLVFAVGLYYSIRTGFFQIWGLPQWWGETLGASCRRKQKTGTQGTLNQFQTLATALGSTVGTSSIAGVATAIYLGGAGAIFWMWISALLGMMTSYAEKVLAIRYRYTLPSGAVVGGPAEYILRGLGFPSLAKLFCLACVLASFCGGNLVQANSIASGVAMAWDIPPRITGLILVLLTASVLWGGIERIGRVCTLLVPFMAICFVLGGIWVMICHAQALPQALTDILKGAFTPQASGAGLLASYPALRYGVSRGVFTNEAGMGSSAMAHAVSNTQSPHQQGLWGILEVYLATLVIASISALVILTAGIYQADAMQGVGLLSETALLGVPLAVHSFATVMGSGSAVFLSLCLSLFAFSSILGWSYYGERCLGVLLGHKRGITLYRLVFLWVLYLGSCASVDMVWCLADISNGLMTLPNVCALFLLSPEVLALWKNTQKNRKFY